MFAKKKCEVLKNYLKSIADVDLIQLISWSLPKECQKSVMPMIHTKLSSFLEALKKYEEDFEKEPEELETIREEEPDSDN